MNLFLVGCAAVAVFLALWLWAAVVAGAREDRAMEEARRRWDEDEDGYPPVGV
jgi:hypothetical protein